MRALEREPEDPDRAEPKANQEGRNQKARNVLSHPSCAQYEAYMQELAADYQRTHQRRDPMRSERWKP